VDPDGGFVVSFLGQGLRVLAAAPAYPVESIFDDFPVQDAVAAVEPFPCADGAQFHRTVIVVSMPRPSRCSR
jgi:hypothetical protein